MPDNPTNDQIALLCDIGEQYLSKAIGKGCAFLGKRCVRLNEA